MAGRLGLARPGDVSGGLAATQAGAGTQQTQSEQCQRARFGDAHRDGLGGHRECELRGGRLTLCGQEALADVARCGAVQGRAAEAEGGALTVVEEGDRACRAAWAEHEDLGVVGDPRKHESLVQVGKAREAEQVTAGGGTT
ncbi:hypothetical protein RZS08_35620, partial [Arthrospira platensis SPKY1]|nr:hypothetical protein [Arthrospira platensis SPKY1]